MSGYNRITYRQDPATKLILPVFAKAVDSANGNLKSLYYQSPLTLYHVSRAKTEASGIDEVPQQGTILDTVMYALVNSLFNDSIMPYSHYYVHHVCYLYREGSHRGFTYQLSCLSEQPNARLRSYGVTQGEARDSSVKLSVEQVILGVTLPLQENYIATQVSLPYETNSLVQKKEPGSIPREYMYGHEYNKKTTIQLWNIIEPENPKTKMQNRFFQQTQSYLTNTMSPRGNKSLAQVKDQLGPRENKLMQFSERSNVISTDIENITSRLKPYSERETQEGYLENRILGTIRYLDRVLKSGVFSREEHSAIHSLRINQNQHYTNVKDLHETCVQALRGIAGRRSRSSEIISRFQNRFKEKSQSNSDDITLYAEKFINRYPLSYALKIDLAEAFLNAAQRYFIHLQRGARDSNAHEVRGRFLLKFENCCTLVETNVVLSFDVNTDSLNTLVNHINTTIGICLKSKGVSSDSYNSIKSELLSVCSKSKYRGNVRYEKPSLMVDASLIDEDQANVSAKKRLQQLCQEKMQAYIVETTAIYKENKQSLRDLETQIRGLYTPIGVLLSTINNYSLFANSEDETCYNSIEQIYNARINSPEPQIIASIKEQIITQIRNYRTRNRFPELTVPLEQMPDAISYGAWQSTHRAIDQNYDYWESYCKLEWSDQIMAFGLPKYQALCQIIENAISRLTSTSGKIKKGNIEIMLSALKGGVVVNPLRYLNQDDRLCYFVYNSIMSKANDNRKMLKRAKTTTATLIDNGIRENDIFLGMNFNNSREEIGIQQRY